MSAHSIHTTIQSPSCSNYLALQEVSMGNLYECKAKFYARKNVNNFFSCIKKRSDDYQNDTDEITKDIDTFSINSDYESNGTIFKQQYPVFSEEDQENLLNKRFSNYQNYRKIKKQKPSSFQIQNDFNALSRQLHSLSIKKRIKKDQLNLEQLKKLKKKKQTNLENWVFDKIEPFIVFDEQCLQRIQASLQCLDPVILMNCKNQSIEAEEHYSIG